MTWVKRFVAVFLFFVLFSVPAFAVERRITFAWDPNQESYLTGYKLYVSFNQQGGPYTLQETYGLVTTGQTVVDLDPGEVAYFVLTAYANAAAPMPYLESGYSNEVFFSLAADDPGSYPMAAPVFRLISAEPASSSR